MVKSDNRSKFLRTEQDFDKMATVGIDWGNGLKPGEPVQVPPSKVAEFVHLSESLQNARSYKIGVLFLKSYLRQIGLIQHYDKLIVFHASRQGPEVILKTGIWPAQEAIARLGENNVGNMTGQKVGDGIYTIGTEATGWQPQNTWGNHQYQITLEDVWVMHNNNNHANAFMELYLMLRKKWGLSIRDGFDGIFAPGMAFELMSRMKWAYEDLNVSAATFGLEILLKFRRIDPGHIRYLGSLGY